MIIWNSTATTKSPEHWYGKYQPRKKIAIITTRKFDINLVIKVSATGTQFQPGLISQNIAISMNGVLVLAFGQWCEINDVINEAEAYIKDRLGA